MTMPTEDIPLGAIRDAGNGLEQTNLVACGLTRARQLIATPDENIRSQSPFDRHSRIGIPQGAAVVDEALFLQYLTTQVTVFSETEIAALKSIIHSLRPIFAETPMRLPETVYLIKTTGREEGAAAYTKHLDTICLPANMVASILDVPPGGDPLHAAQSTKYLAGIITHEFFHILSKNNPDWRRKLYEMLDFDLLDTPVELPSDIMASGLPMCDLKITNPDAPLLNVTTRMVPPGGSDPVPMAPALISRSAYVGGEFFDTLNWIFLQLDEDGAIATANGRSVWWESKDMMAQYMPKIGYNLTGELFHPDEVLAQSFVLAAHQPSLPLLQNIAGTIWPDRAVG